MTWFRRISRPGSIVERRPHLAARHDRQALRRDADDGRVVAVERDRAADERRVAAETAPPQAFADEHHRGRAGLLFRFGEPAPDDRVDAEERHHRRADRGAGELFRIAEAAQIEGGRADRAQPGERLRLLLPGEVVQDRGAEIREVQLVVLLRHLDQPGGFDEGQRPDQLGVHEAEDDRVGADAKRDGQDDREREDRRPTQRADGVAEILQQHVGVLLRGGANEIEQEAAAGGGRARRATDRGRAGSFPARTRPGTRRDSSGPARGTRGRPTTRRHACFGARPLARAWRRSFARRADSSIATRRPSGVMR